MIRFSQFFFSTAKYFLDHKHQNIRIQTINQVGFSNISKIIVNNDVNLTYIKSQCSTLRNVRKKYEFDLSIQKKTPEKLQNIKKQFIQLGASFKIYNPISVPWFPKELKDLNLIGKKLLQVKDKINNDHIQFTDKQYRKRRNYIAEVALNYKMGEKIPQISYTREQTDLWVKIYEKLSKLHQKIMCKRYLDYINELQKEFMISKRIPQMNELNAYLNNKTGFSLKPTHGILSQRQFLNCLAFRVLCCTQYIRNTATPDYTPEPDLIHEVIGHASLIADPDVADLSQQIGLLSLGATDEQISQLGSLYNFTLEFGALVEGDKKLGYGAGLGSSVSQIEHFMSSKAKFEPFQPIKNCKETYPIQHVQNVYYFIESFEKAILDLEQYGKTLKPFSTSYNQQTKKIQYDRNIEAIDIGDRPIQFV